MIEHVNKKRKRRIEGTDDGKLWYCFQDDKLVDTGGQVDRKIAFDYLHGKEAFEGPFKPSTDEMIEAVAEGLEREVRNIMEYVLTNEDTLKQAYLAAKGKTRMLRLWW